ncbi:PH domain-containing protein [Marinicella rhabdoformis]|uniref:PH domain-containing protein n=1 Tax=Marinicella rhabdoformis TaxID=2580566 RepID=UPI0012AED6ED|nr:PH domain-containing protein [Marinicella rhabdoformis]
MKTFSFRPLADAYLPMILIINWIWTAITLIPAFILTYFAADFDWYHAVIISLSIWVLVGILFHAYSRAYIKRYQYGLTEEGLMINRGVFWRQMICLPRNRVQHIDITTGPFERRRGLSKLIVHTAGTRDASVTLHGLTAEDAADLRHELIVTNQGDSV